MITLTARISLLDTQHGTIGGGSINKSKNNISSDFSGILATKKVGGKPFLLNADKLDNGMTYSDNVNYYIGSVGANENKIFTNPYNITISGTNITAFEILFDNVNNRYPTSIVVDGNTYENDDPNFTVNVETSNTHTISISNLNMADYPLVILGIYIDIVIYVDNKNLISLTSLQMSRGDIEKPSFGIIANSGNIEFNDLNGEIREYAEQRFLTSNLTVSIDIKNNLVDNKVEQVAKYVTDKWNYDNENRKISLSLSDDLMKWQDITIGTLGLDDWGTTNYASTTGLDVYNKLVALSSGWEFDTLDINTYNLLNSIVIGCPILNGASLWNMWQNLCYVGGLYVYKDKNGKVKVVNDFGGDN